ncbi:xanthine dehydrogenase accessory protein XdhC [Oceanisphaera arctica]|uniref:Xanthine dehydrogenase accessory protein XdhC n=1 Tax=Oceanisphaera arctica TaxID=641510 RepID=A0A2P5TN93_9GAMM|nr:xanthine dehydrogenase accessory protein XdhC [Oceanisphaera arctica]PPL17024.1 xanthine dehydrogenase accessory protein XdhC [Oceanisphaera arctica]GHA07302.1 xanthine dehydrogenase accessory protein XdhC [Oceanisphaera arctica]
MFKDNWIQVLAELERRSEPCVLVTVVEHKGSTPRDSGTKMLVTEQGCYATIGGGHLEYKALKLARDMLMQGEQQMKVERFNLGASLGQCCGGMATIMLEPVVRARHHLVLFGAGHVAKALVHILATLPFRITWIDERESEFPVEQPSGVTKLVSEDPVAEIDSQPAGSFYLVMTHNHQLDLELCARILKRGDARYFGVIGSRTKRKRFDYKLKERGFDEAALARMICPIGLPEVTGKHPAEIAVSVAGELIAAYQQPVKAATGTPADERKAVADEPASVRP